MPNLLSGNGKNDVLEQTMIDALGPGSLPRFSTDEEFLDSLLKRSFNLEIDGVNSLSKRSSDLKIDGVNFLQPRLPSYRIWIDGLSRGAVAAACGFILFTSLNILPSILVNYSVTGAFVAQKNMVELSWRGRMLWQQFIVNLENQMR